MALNFTNCTGDNSTVLLQHKPAYALGARRHRERILETVVTPFRREQLGRVETDCREGLFTALVFWRLFLQQFECRIFRALLEQYHDHTQLTGIVLVHEMRGHGIALAFHEVAAWRMEVEPQLPKKETAILLTLSKKLMVSLASNIKFRFQK